MDKIHLIMPMGGGGTRFGNKGFDVPKPLIGLQGKPFFYWATKSVEKFVDIEDLTFVVLQDHIDRFQIDIKIKEHFPDAEIVVIPEVLNGAVLTCKEGVKNINDDLPILFNDCDHAFLSKDFYDYCKKGEFDEIDGALLTFESDNPAYSYVIFDGDRVTGTIEKQVASNEAICGAYYFKNRTSFEKYVEEYLKECQYAEFFVSGVYNEMAKDGCVIKTFKIDEHISFGTPDEYDVAVNDERLKELD